MSTEQPSAFAGVVACVGGLITLAEAVRYRLYVLRLIAAADERRFVDRAVAELAEATGELNVADEARRNVVSQLAVELAVTPEELSLRRIIDLAPEGVAAALREHKGRLDQIQAEIQVLSADARRLIGTNLEVLANMDEAVRGSAGTYGPDGRSVPAAGRHRVQRSL